jgi:hypothetical protein
MFSGYFPQPCDIPVSFLKFLKLQVSLVIQPGGNKTLVNEGQSKLGGISGKKNMYYRPI